MSQDKLEGQKIGGRCARVITKVPFQATEDNLVVAFGQSAAGKETQSATALSIISSMGTAITEKSVVSYTFAAVVGVPTLYKGAKWRVRCKRHTRRTSV